MLTACQAWHESTRGADRVSRGSENGVANNKDRNPDPVRAVTVPVRSNGFRHSSGRSFDHSQAAT